MIYLTWLLVVLSGLSAVSGVAFTVGSFTFTLYKKGNRLHYAVCCFWFVVSLIASIGFTLGWYSVVNDFHQIGVHPYTWDQNYVYDHAWFMDSFWSMFKNSCYWALFSGVVSGSYMFARSLIKGEK